MNDLLAGTVVGGGYRIVRALAEGGMGTVYEAVQEATGARRAVKIMHGQFAKDEGLRARFEREARIAAAIPSEHVAQVLDAGQDPETGALYIVMELLEGTTLSRELRRSGGLPWADVCEILRQLCHALGAAHRMGIVHRDLKPANIFFARSRHASMTWIIKVLDFGIAKAMAGAGGEATSAILGTPAWMAPEQTTVDEGIGPPADVWALGLLTFSLLTGKHFFPAGNAKSAPTAALLREVCLDPIAPASVRAADLGRADRSPPGFDGWLAKCLDRAPERRFPEAWAAYEALVALPAPTPAEPVEPLPTLLPTEDTPAPLRVDTPATAIETPHPSTASFVRVTARTEGSASTTTTTGRGGRRGPLVGAMVGVAVVGAAAFFGWRAHVGGDLPGAVNPAREANPAPSASAAPPLVRLHGSNTIGAELVPALAEAFLARRTGGKTIVRRQTAPDEMLVEARDGDRVAGAIEVFAHGSSTAFEDLAANKCDVGMASRRVRDDELTRLSSLGNLASAASEHVVALDGLAIIVNPANPVSVLTKQQIDEVFSGATRSWAAASGPDRPVHIYARDDRSGTFDTFRTMILGKDTLDPGAKRYESSEGLSDAVSADESGVGFIGLPYVRSAKAVMVREGSTQPLLPSPITLATEDYPLARRLYLYAPLGAPQVARDFVDFALSAEGQRVVQATGFVDLRPECDANAAAQCPRCSRAYRDAVRSACRVSVDFRFEAGTNRFDTRSQRDLQRVASLLGQPEYAGRRITLLGFSDGAGARAENTALSQDRADTVAEQLRARGLYVGAVRAMGSDLLVADDGAPGGKERNRRVEVWLKTAP